MSEGRAVRETFVSPLSFPGWTLFWLAVTVVAAGFLLMLRNPPAPASFYLFLLLPLGAAYLAWIDREPRFELALDDEGFEVASLGRRVPYADVRVLSHFGRDPSKPGKGYQIRIATGTAWLLVPSTIQPGSEILLRTLGARIPESAEGTTNADLAAYHHRQVEMFGAERVFAYNVDLGRRFSNARRRLLIRMAQLCLVCAVVWGVGSMLDVANARSAMVVPSAVGGACCVALVLGLVQAGMRRDAVPKKQWRQSSIVVSPVGMALAQGPIVGELAWNQLLDVREHNHLVQGGVQSYDPCPIALTLTVEGTSIDVAEIYDRPLFLIAERILRYWRPEFAGSVFAEEPL